MGPVSSDSFSGNELTHSTGLATCPPPPSLHSDLYSGGLRKAGVRGMAQSHVPRSMHLDQQGERMGMSNPSPGGSLQEQSQERPAVYQSPLVPPFYFTSVALCIYGCPIHYPQWICRELRAKSNPTLWHLPFWKVRKKEGDTLDYSPGLALVCNPAHRSQVSAYTIMRNCGYMGSRFRVHETNSERQYWDSLLDDNL